MQAVTIIQTTPEELQKLISDTIRSAFFEREKPNTCNDEPLTIQEAADLLNLSVQTLYGYVSKRQIPFSKPGKRLFFNRAELLLWVKEGRQKTTKEIEAEAHNSLTKKSNH